jgi:hypothetical protein
VARRWRLDPAAVEAWPADTWIAVCDLLATEEIHHRRAEGKKKARARR